MPLLDPLAGYAQTRALKAHLIFPLYQLGRVIAFASYCHLQRVWTLPDPTSCESFHTLLAGLNSLYYSAQYSPAPTAEFQQSVNDIVTRRLSSQSLPAISVNQDDIKIKPSANETIVSVPVVYKEQATVTELLADIEHFQGAFDKHVAKSEAPSRPVVWRVVPIRGEQ